MEKVDYDFLDKCTKEELIFHIRREGWLRQSFKYSDVLFSRWHKRSEEIQEKRRLNREFLNSIDGKKQDNLAHKFNAEKSIPKKLEIAEKMKPYHIKFKQWKKEHDKIIKAENVLNILYKSIDIQRNNEI